MWTVTIMTVASTITAVGIGLVWWQVRRETNATTLSHIPDIAKQLYQFQLDTDDMLDSDGCLKEYTKETEQFYIKIVDPYINLLFWIYLQLKHHAFNKKIIQPYTYHIKEGYKRIKPYLEYYQEDDPNAWIEIDKLMKKLCISLDT